MVVRKCRSCDAVWHSSVRNCAFCGRAGEEQLAAAAQTAVAVMDRPDGAPRVDTPPPAPLPDEAPPLPEPAEQIDVPPPPAPRLPSALVPLLFALLGLGAAAALPAAAWTAPERVAAVLLFLGVALFAPFAPLAWWTAARYERRCDLLGFRPSGAARAGRFLGVAVTLLLAAEGSALAFLQALQRLQ